MKATIEFENNFIVFHVENDFVSVHSEFIQYQRVSFDSDYKHKSRDF